MTRFADLYQSYARDVYRFALYLTGDPSLADDVTSETFIRIWSSPEPVRLATVKAYLLTIARNLPRDVDRHLPPTVRPRPNAELRPRIDVLGKPICNGARHCTERMRDEVCRSLKEGELGPKSEQWIGHATWPRVRRSEWQAWRGVGAWPRTTVMRRRGRSRERAIPES